ncbi:hypothetical protein KUL72_12280 [Bradyrhizobium arachidis]|uniref:hypothetical protein n=1 Tax=Bradyrhizobium TaxID=374 RepID=UPI00188A99D8|nr:MULTISPECIES: hypothetical protein [Bradyrhizobium]MDN4983928.1 hypothetical protein [Bradyrhizobium sp. WYCCWR 13022]QOZ51882.1 hypothetical protein XH90_11240 [Bradyrhizobium sp. CCBAU 53338]UVO39064.1 hypothetical protein KUL72_12280 [Bradyrhizobium arachidis]
MALLHARGVEFGGTMPLIEADTFTVWSATSVRLRDVLRRDGEVIKVVRNWGRRFRERREIPSVFSETNE